MWWLPAIQGVIGLGQAAYGFARASQLERPEYEIPEAQEQALGLQRSYMSQRKMPGQTIAEENIKQNQANMLSAIRAQGGSPADVAKLGESTDEAFQGLGARASMWQTEQKDRYLGQLGQMAGYQDKMWQLNKYQPFQDEAAMSSAKIGSGMQNVMGGLQGIGDVQGAISYRNWLDDQYGMKGGDNTGDTESLTPQTKQYIYNSIFNPYGMSGGDNTPSGGMNYGYQPNRRATWQDRLSQNFGQGLNY